MRSDLMQNTISDMARYIKNIIPPNIPETYTLKAMFEHVSGEENIRNGILAFRDLLYLVCDRLIADGSLHDKIETFPLPLQEKVSRGYGCNKKLFGEPCQKGCHGFSFPLDDSIIDIRQDIEVWLDREVSCLQRKKHLSN
jgi:hypothetical protein